MLRMSPYMRRPMENFGTDEHENSHSTYVLCEFAMLVYVMSFVCRLGNRKSLETNIEVILSAVSS